MTTITSISSQLHTSEQVETDEHDTDFLAQWLDETLTQSDELGYAHRLLKEQTPKRDRIIGQLRSRVRNAHEDTRRRLRRLAEYSFDPLDEVSVDPAHGYPDKLPLTTLKGYVGEIFAAIVAEEFAHFGSDEWTVPAYPFRFHRQAFYYLEKLRQGAPVPAAVVGRFGNDMLAFVLNSDGQISRSLVCEAKCTAGHRATLIADAHKQVSDLLSCPLDVLYIVEILSDYDDHESAAWRQALGQLFASSESSGHERFDLVCYVCGRSSVQKTNWIPSDSPHPDYTGGRKLESIEIHLNDVEQLIDEIYGRSEGMGSDIAN